MSQIKKILMTRDGMSEDDATALIKEAQDAMNEYLDEGNMEAAYDICNEYFGLEPDYVMELMP